MKKKKINNYKMAIIYYRISIICFLTVIIANWIAGSTPRWGIFDEVMGYVLLIFGAIWFVFGIYKENSKKK